jgi:predicted ribosome-associated RNA-binding protein Tma20
MQSIKYGIIPDSGASELWIFPTLALVNIVQSTKYGIILDSGASE